MVSAETVGGKLKEAATKKADESILIQIADKDLALKVKYKVKQLVHQLGTRTGHHMHQILLE